MIAFRDAFTCTCSMEFRIRISAYLTMYYNKNNIPSMGTMHGEKILKSGVIYVYNVAYIVFVVIKPHQKENRV